MGPATFHDMQVSFAKLFGGEPRVFRAPGRVNLIGEHTDYNDGFVMPAAIGYYTWIAVAPRRDRRLRVHSQNFNETRELDLGVATKAGEWTDYVLGVALELAAAGHEVSGADMVIHGEVPIGSGLSSSAAIEVATAYALSALAGIDLDLTSLAKICQAAENRFVGTRCGIMDQFVSARGHPGRALSLDCRSLAYELVPLPEGVRLVVCNTMLRHSLATGEYNTRRRECETGVRHLAQSVPGIRALRDVTPHQLEQYGRDLPSLVYRRCRHVISENARVEESARALARGDMAAFGNLMYASHASLRDDYEVSCRELDLMVDIARATPGAVGARMTGGGFGGCTVNLVRDSEVRGFCESVSSAYGSATGKTPELYVCTPAAGVHEVRD
jgi:galactokinase